MKEKGLPWAVRLGAKGKLSMGVVYSGCWGGTILVQVNASELASRSGTREKECDLQVLSELGSHSPTLFNVCSSYGK